MVTMNLNTWYLLLYVCANKCSGIQINITCLNSLTIHLTSRHRLPDKSYMMGIEKLIIKSWYMSSSVIPTLYLFKLGN